MYLNVHAIVLRSEKFGEKDKRLSLYTREQGRLWALAKGAGRPGAKLGPATEPGVEAGFRLWMGAGKPVARVTGGGVAASFAGLRRGWSRLGTALFLCEWTDRLTPLHQPHPEKYDLLRQALSALETGPETEIRLAFLAQFLAQAGYGPSQAAPELLRGHAPEPLLETLDRYDFDAPRAVEGLEDHAPRLEERLLQFVSPLLSRPFKALAHHRSLKSYMTRHLMETAKT